MEILEKEVGAKGEVVIPQKWREELELKSGTKVILERSLAGIIIKPKIANPVEALAKLRVRLGKAASHKIIAQIRAKIDAEHKEL